MVHQHGDPIERMNAHVEQLLAIARVLGGHPDATSARVEAVDTRGFDLCIVTPASAAVARIEFMEPIRENDYPEGVRVAFVRLARRAKNDTTAR